MNSTRLAFPFRERACTASLVSRASRPRLAGFGEAVVRRQRRQFKLSSLILPRTASAENGATYRHWSAVAEAKFSTTVSLALAGSTRPEAFAVAESCPRCPSRASRRREQKLPI